MEKSCEILDLCLWVFASPVTLIQVDFCLCECEGRTPDLQISLFTTNTGFACPAGNAPLCLESLDHPELPQHQSTGDQESSKTRCTDTTHRLKHIFWNLHKLSITTFLIKISLFSKNHLDVRTAFFSFLFFIPPLVYSVYFIWV